jgi:DNA-binding transcriptional ArsR family regulator
MKSFKVISAPEAFQLLADETRRRVIYLLRAKEMTVAQIAEKLKLTPQAIYHHIRKLKDADMIEVAREERVDHFIETYYRATAEMFNLAHGESGSAKVMEEGVREALDALGELGFQAKIEPLVVTQVVQIMQGLKGPESESPWTERVNELEGVDPFAKQELLEYVYLITIADKEFEQFIRSYRDLRKALRSTLEPAPSTEKA